MDLNIRAKILEENIKEKIGDIRLGKATVKKKYKQQSGGKTFAKHMSNK